MDLVKTPEIMTKIGCLLFFIEMSCRNFKARKTGFEENYDRRNFIKSTALKCCEKQKRLRHFVVISINIILLFDFIVFSFDLIRKKITTTSFDENVI